MALHGRQEDDRNFCVLVFTTITGSRFTVQNKIHQQQALEALKIVICTNMGHGISPFSCWISVKNAKENKPDFFFYPLVRFHQAKTLLF